MSNKDYTGQKINSYTVICKLDKKFKNKNTMYLCLCDCGIEFETETGYMKQKFGCNKCSKQHHYEKAWKSRKSNVKLKPRRTTKLSKLSPESENGKRGSYANYIVNWIKQTATKRKLSWNLDSIEVFNLIQQPCFYCGTKVNFPETRNGIDRLDNNLGYITTNVVPCCYVCNIAKHQLSISDFKKHIMNIYIHWASKT